MHALSQAGIRILASHAPSQAGIRILASPGNAELRRVIDLPSAPSTTLPRTDQKMSLSAGPSTSRMRPDEAEIAAPWSAPLLQDVLTVESLGEDLDVAALGVALAFLALLDKSHRAWLASGTTRRTALSTFRADATDPLVLLHGRPRSRAHWSGAPQRPMPLASSSPAHTRPPNLQPRPPPIRLRTCNRR